MRGFINQLYSIDQDSFILILAICGCATAILKVAVDRPLFVALTGLTLLPSSLLCRALMLELDITPTYDMTINEMAAAGAGIIMAFLVMSMSMVAVERLRD